MTQQQPEDFAADAEVDDSTRLAARRQNMPEPELDDSTRLATRRQQTDDAAPAAEAEAPEELDDSTRLATRRQPSEEPADIDDSTRLATRRQPHEEPVDIDDSTHLATRRRASEEPAEIDDSTRLATRRPASDAQQAGAEQDEADSTRLSARSSVPPVTTSTPTMASAPLHAKNGKSRTALPPGALPEGMRVRQGSFGTSTEAYTPRSASAPLPITPPVFAEQGPDVSNVEPTLTPVDVQRRREAAHRASVTKAIAVGVTVLVIGSAAVIGIVLLVRGLM